MPIAIRCDEERNSTASDFAQTRLPTINVLGIPVANVSETETLDWLFARHACGIRTCVNYLNAHCSNVAAFDLDYSEALSKADLILPDGCGVRVCASLHRQHLGSRLTFTDFTPLVCRRLAAIGGSVFLLGGGPGIAEAAAETLVKSCPGLRIAGTHHGYFSEDQGKEVIRLINGSGAQLLLCAMGVPYQELWLSQVMPFLNPTLVFGVGGLFDFLSGRIPRAPMGLQAIGMEWAYRLCQEPKRMWKRYLLGNPLFLVRAVWGIVQARIAAARRAPEITGKRILDIIASVTGLVVLLVPMLLIAATIRLTSPGPAILRQRRVGKEGKLFTMYKFRTMCKDAPLRFHEIVHMNELGLGNVTFKMARDPRITPVGRWLRRSSLDELPQLWNVLKGDMSLVGPRPQLPTEVMHYTDKHRHRLHARPGLTGLSQISGRANLTFEQQVQLDLYYLRHHNLLLDILILLKTVPVVVSASGAY
jgi:exopolysaccharide biosynthesis WecB/TagA/CpsF family protein